MTASEALREMARRVVRERRKARVMHRLASKIATSADLDKADTDARIAQLKSMLANEEAKNAKLRAERAAVSYTEAVTGSTACGEAALRLRRAAAGRREYIGMGGDPAQAGTIEMCARVVEGDLTPLTYWLPSWQWTADMLD